MERPPEMQVHPGQVYRLAWVFYLVLAIGGSVWIGVRQGRIPLRLFVGVGEWWVDVGAGVAAGLLLALVWEGGRRRLRLARELEQRIGEVLGGLGAPEALALAALSGFAEELFFRGAVQGSLGWLAASLLFALLHTGPGPAFRLWTVFAALAGALFGALMAWRGNLLSPILAHFLVNAINLRRLGRPGHPLVDSPSGTSEKEKET
ncbi:MAG TPA: CPBP family glutamic-type intramembrane protease [Thermoanaerobaculia bacterium]|nr:CPBP family glutamic-type intramembrane protease [Thermoanaerobaculia bacterium]